MDSTSRIDPSEVVEKRRHPKALPANINIKQTAEHCTLMVGISARDLAGLAQIVDPDAVLESVPGLEDLCTSVLKRQVVDVVITPLTSASFDAMDVAQRLTQLGYDGHLAVLAPPLPNPAMVERELAGVAKTATIQLVAPKANWRTLA